MKILQHIFIVGLLFFSLACKSNKSAITTEASTSTATNMKANLIDGDWEVNYIMNLPKPFAEVYSKVKPTISFNSKEGKVSGITGCNNFNGSITIDGKKIRFGEEMATTRKMCPDMTGEEFFLETLKKVNTYSVTDQGKMLNLIMGDIGVMRLERK